MQVLRLLPLMSILADYTLRRATTAVSMNIWTYHM
jgi:hypothetical protein